MSKTQIVVLWGLAVVVVVVFAVMSQVMSRSSERTAPGPVAPAKVYSLSEIGESARKLYPLADQAARSWQSDARLVSATANWPFVDLDHLSEAAPWVFQFYSPTTRKIYVFSVEGEQVVLLREALSPYALKPISMEGWQLDSHQALAAWLNDGGGWMVGQYSVVDVTARLRHSEEGQLIWVVVGSVRGDQEIHLTQVDAASGSVIK